MNISASWVGNIPVAKTDGTYPHYMVMLPPLFDELNRMRRTLVQVMRMAAAQGIGSALIDFPNYGENQFQATQFNKDSFTNDLLHVANSVCPADGKLHTAAFRGGTLFDMHFPAQSSWRFSPQDAQAVDRDIKRLPPSLQQDAVELCSAAPSALTRRPTRTVRLITDPAPAELKIGGPPLWRWPEPGEAPALTAALAEDLVLWIKSCAAS